MTTAPAGDRFNFGNSSLNKTLEDLHLKACSRLITDKQVSYGGESNSSSLTQLQTASDANGFVQGLTLQTSYVANPSVILSQLVDLIANEDDKTKRRILADTIKYIQGMSTPVRYYEPWPTFPTIGTPYPNDITYKVTCEAK